MNSPVVEIPDFASLKEYLIATGVAPAGVIGCSDSEITQIEQRWELPLPSEYRQFLEIMGRDAGRFLLGSDVYFPDCLDIREAVEGLFEETLEDLGKNISLPIGSVVFLLHQGYEFYSLHSDKQVYYFSEGPAEFVPLRRTLLQFLADCARSAAKHSR